jgi:hypothetical protein
MVRLELQTPEVVEVEAGVLVLPTNAAEEMAVLVLLLLPILLITEQPAQQVLPLTLSVAALGDIHLLVTEQ